MTSSESSHQAHATSPTQKKHNKHKKTKRGTSYRRHGSGDQKTTRKKNNNHDDQSDMSTHEGNKMADTATGVIGTCVQMLTKNDTQHQGTLSDASLIAQDHLERLLQNSRDFKYGSKKNDLAPSTGTNAQIIKKDDSVDDIAVKGMKGKNVFKTDQEISGNRARQERHLQHWQPSTTEVLNEDTLTSLELSHSSSFSDIPCWDQFATNEKLFGIKTDFDEELYTTKLDRSAADFKAREQKAIALANEIERSSSNNPHVLEERGRISEYETWDEEDRYSTVNKHAISHNENETQRPHKSSVKTYESRKLHRNNNWQNCQHYQSNTDNQTTRSSTSVQPANKSTTTIKTTANTFHTNSTDTQRNHHYTKTVTVPRTNRKHTHYQNKKWIRNDANVHNTITKKDDSPTINNAEYAANNNKTPVVLLAPSFKLNIMATEFIPSGGSHFLHNEIKTNDIAPSTSTTSSDSSLSTPQTPPSRNQESSISVNGMFLAPFNKPGYLRPLDTDPLWSYGSTSYRNLYGFSAPPDISFPMNQWYYGYPQFNSPSYPMQLYAPYYHQQQQYKFNPQNVSNMTYPAPAFQDNTSTHVANHQSYLGVFPYQNHHYHQGENQHSTFICN